MATLLAHKVVSSLPGTLVANTIYLVRTGAGFDLYVSDSTGSVAHRVNGLSVEGAATLTGGFNVTPFANGTRSSGTLTPDPLNGNIQTAVNGGAHTLAPPATSCTMVIQYTNNASAGTITVSGFTQVTGDDLTTTNGHDFLFFITKIGSFSLLDVRALQ
ncbi:hypothetical protein SAMN06265173_11241 [Thalassovita litoralis]|uniref:Uncharacterized protein n=1 Tax=Thalassovita litoralis TaxID=1010611 RepID=A0A521DQT5_9RHOB|nr:hypothetical protein [Thalassovita litoralis]SMO73935.1 hypothetical protein SAMN06265173_11241 [Thalassovita litoralis]